MKIAALGDIHSNHIALEACCEWIEKNNIDGIAFLGDYVSDCPYPQKTMSLLRKLDSEYPCYFVRGNREDYMLAHRYRLTEEWEYNSQSGSLLYTFENLTGEDMRFFEAMPVGMEIKLDGYPVFSICHGSMQDNRRLFFGESEDTYSVIDELTTSLTLCGHCHIPYSVTRNGKTIINGGTVGIPCNGQTDAQFLVLQSDGGEWTASQISVPYDRQRVIEEFHESGLDKKADVWARSIIAMLKTGRHYNDECVRLVRKMCAERQADFSDEELWQEAASVLGI